MTHTFAEALCIDPSELLDEHTSRFPAHLDLGPE